jgi:hypothetical protein
MDLEIHSVNRWESGDSPLAERFLLGLVRLASLPLFLLVIVLTSLIYGVAILFRTLTVFVALGSRLLSAPAPLKNRPVKAQDA